MEKNTDFTISNMTGLEIALMEENKSAVETYLERIDRETSNEMFRVIGQHFGFPTVEIQGVRRASAAHLAKLLGYKNPQGLLHLLDRYGISGVMVGGFIHSVRIQIKQALSLDPDDNRSILLEYKALLIAAMQSTNEEAKPIKLYLLRCEYVARVGAVALRPGTQPATSIDNPMDRMTMQKLAKQANGGDQWAIYELKTHYGWPVELIAGLTEPDVSEVAATISRLLRIAYEEKLTDFGLEVGETSTGYYVYGRTYCLHETFLNIIEKHHLQRFFSHPQNLGWIMAREAEALAALGWERKKHTTYQGDRSRYRYEYARPKPELAKK